jgi:peptidoglycan/LPS O-acetylase OafA/YrhL
MNKFVFANQLRGLAAILVVMTHYFGTYFAEQALLAQRTFSPDLHLKPAPWVHLLELPYQGPLGVAIFFLISGFVIPFSLQKNTTAGFLLHRALRIFPTYACCLALGMLAVWLSARYWGQPFSYQGDVFAANALLIHNLLGYPSVDAVNWTLSIEFKFYLLAAVGALAVFKRHIGWLLGFLAVAMLATWGQAHTPTLPSYFITLTMELNYLVFMLTGIQFHKHVTGLITTRGLAVRVALILATFCVTWSLGPQQGQFPDITLFYFCAVAVFAASYLARDRFRPRPLLDFFAAISYPLYCVHSLFGYCMLKFLMGGLGLPFVVSVLLTLPCTITLAWLVHRTVETGSNRLGRLWSAALFQRRLRAQAA